MLNPGGARPRGSTHSKGGERTRTKKGRVNDRAWKKGGKRGQCKCGERVQAKALSQETTVKKGIESPTRTRKGERRNHRGGA